LWQQDLKQVLDDGLMSKIGIPPDRWDWHPGKAVHDDPNWYPNMPGYGDFIDPPYEIGVGSSPPDRGRVSEGENLPGRPSDPVTPGAKIVRGGGGWVVISAADLARFGLLVATGGFWNGERVIGNDWLRGHGGGNGSLMAGDPDTLTSIGVVTAEGFEWPLPGEVFVG
jgi:CubicO group peptidase (beta-lactamase class C family)